MGRVKFNDPITNDEISQRLTAHPEFSGNKDHLARLYRIIDTPRSSYERRDILSDWGKFNTTRSDSSYNRQEKLVIKSSYREFYRGIDIRGLKLDGQIIGPIDLRGADLRGVRFSKVVMTKADFSGADLRGADLTGCWFRGATFSDAQIQGANFKDAFLGDANLRGVTGDKNTSFEGSDLQGANLSMANLIGSSLKNANLQLAQLLETNLQGADISGCQVFGIAAWSPKINGETNQNNLLVTPAEPRIKVGDRGRRHNVVEISEQVDPLFTGSLEHAHLMYLMLNPDLSNLLESVTNKGVLLLGRFSGKHGKVLDALRISLRSEGYLPLKFDFRRPEDRTLKETVLTLAGLCRFIVADLTEASSIPLELNTIIKDYKIPIVPIYRKGHRTFSMFESIEQEYRDRILAPLEYNNHKDLIKVVKKAIIKPALVLATSLIHSKSYTSESRKTQDYLT